MYNKVNYEYLTHLLHDARLYDYHKLEYAKGDIWYIEYDWTEDRFIYHFNDYEALLDKQAYDTMIRLYGKRTIDLHHLGDYDEK